MITTNDRFTASLNGEGQDPITDVARARACSVTAPAYLSLATIPTTPTPTAARVWSEFGRKAMTNVDFHDRWPLLSTS